jgi:hypothetical protein
VRRAAPGPSPEEYSKNVPSTALRMAWQKASQGSWGVRRPVRKARREAEGIEVSCIWLWHINGLPRARRQARAVWAAHLPRALQSHFL